MTIEVGKLVDDIGLATLNALYPNDFEYYFCALELVDSRGQLQEYFAFPVMPDSIQVPNATVATVHQTMGGISVTDTPQFISSTINIQGSFGRSLKILLGRERLGFTALNVTKTPSLLGTQVKTGYGACKILQRICNESHQLDTHNNPQWLIFYNLAFGESYYVSTGALTFTQDLGSSNAIWKYSLSLNTLGPVVNRLNNVRNNLVASGSTIIQRAATTARKLIANV